MAFPPSFLEEIRARLNLSSVVGRRVKLVKAGREYKACCPFHNEKSPSFYVNDDKNFFHCFGCGAHGDVIGFTMRIDHLAFPEAVEKLAGEAGLEVPRLSPQERQQAERAKGLGDAVEAACVWFQERLFAPEGKTALSYLRGRGLSDDTIQRFRLGFAPEGRSNLQSALKTKGFDQKLILEAALITDPQDGREPFDFFRNRVMFPITDRRGRVIAFGGRVMDDSKPKYLNSRDTPLFHKRGNLYALDKARLAIGEKKAQAIVVEGYMDVIALHQAGFAGAVAPLGTALTEEQIIALWRIHKSPVICLDGDDAGQRAATKTAEAVLSILKPGFSLEFIKLPPGEDPDSLLAQGGSPAFERALARRIYIPDVLWNNATLKFGTRRADERAALEGELKKQLLTILDENVRQAYIGDLIFTRLRSLGRLNSTKLAYQKRGDKFDRKPSSTLKSNLDPEILFQRALETLIVAAVHFPHLFVDASEGLALHDFKHLRLKRLRAHIVDFIYEAISADREVTHEALMAHLVSAGIADDFLSLSTPKNWHDGNPYWHAAFSRIDAPEDSVLPSFENYRMMLLDNAAQASIADAQRTFIEEPIEEHMLVIKSRVADLARMRASEEFDDQFDVALVRKKTLKRA